MSDKKPEGFYIFGEFESRAEDLSDEDLGKVLRWMFASHNRGEVPQKGDLSLGASVLFKMLKVKADTHTENTMRIKKRQSEATARRWAKGKETNSNYKSQQETNRDNTSYPIHSNPILSNPETLPQSKVSWIGLYSTSDFEAAPEEVRRLGPDYYPTREEGSQLPKEVRAWYLAHRPSSDKLGGN